MGLDLLFLAPLQPLTGSFQDAPMRRTVGAFTQAPLLEARSELEVYLGERLETLARARFGAGAVGPRVAHRSLTAVALATHLERAGLSWKVLDPGAIELGRWHRDLARLRHTEPVAVGISTTFLTSVPWMTALIALVRRVFPRAKLLLGGYYYATNAREFLALDGDVLCVGEGELRLPQIVRALRDGASLDAIPGLYLRGPDGQLSYTGPSPALDLQSLPLPDWKLAERIDPPVSLANDFIEATVETQRGCFFRCEFCTYRTLAEIARLDVERACDAILATALPRHGWVYLVDATATYPHARWKAILERLIERGGVSLPMGAYARVSDLDDAAVALMARAGVRTVFIGQESGDQGILNRMKKATRVEQVAPAVAALSRHGVDAYFSFIHGFPGETPESLQATRAMIEGLNRPDPERPACVFYNVTPFSVMDLATASGSSEIVEAKHFIEYTTRGYSAVDVSREVLATLVAVSRVLHAPVYSGVLSWVGVPLGTAAPVVGGAERLETHRWLKAVERGAMSFVEERVFGRRPGSGERERVRAAILGGASPKRTPSLRGRALTLVARRLRAEWSEEGEAGVGLLTRAALGAFALRDTLDPRAALGTALRPEGQREPSSSVDRLARELIDSARLVRRATG